VYQILTHRRDLAATTCRSGCAKDTGRLEAARELFEGARVESFRQEIVTANTGQTLSWSSRLYRMQKDSKLRMGTEEGISQQTVRDPDGKISSKPGNWGAKWYSQPDSSLISAIKQSSLLLASILLNPFEH
jgi:hypothetical protein